MRTRTYERRFRWTRCPSDELSDSHMNGVDISIISARCSYYWDEYIRIFLEFVPMQCSKLAHALLTR